MGHAAIMRSEKIKTWINAAPEIESCLWGVDSDRPQIYLDSGLKYDKLQIWFNGLSSVVLIIPE
jgi:hypothetical protein